MTIPPLPPEQARRSENVHVPVMGAPVPLLKSKSSRPTGEDGQQKIVSLLV